MQCFIRFASLFLNPEFLNQKCVSYDMVPKVEASGIAVLHWELWCEALGSRPLHPAPYEQVKLDLKPRKRKG